MHGWLLGHQSGVFFMANQRSTRVQGICKKLQTVRVAGWPAAWALSWLLEIFFRGEIPGLQVVLLEREGWCFFRGGYVSVMVGEPIDDCERFWRAFWGAWAGSFLEGGLRFLL